MLFRYTRTDKYNNLLIMYQVVLQCQCPFKFKIDTFLHDFSSQGRASSGIPSTSVSIPHSNPFPA